jgi:hypothetical protein
MVNYQNGKIYLIVSKTNKLLYVGSTAQEYLSTRIQNHLNDKQLGKQNCSSYKVLDCDDYYYTLLKDHPCNNKQQLVREEGCWILHYKEHGEGYTCVNDRIAGRTITEWRGANREHILAYHKEYYAVNKEDIAEKHKEYYEANKEQILAQTKEYRVANKSKINEKHECPCGGKYTTQHKARHEKSNLHREYLKTQNE